MHVILKHYDKHRFESDIGRGKYNILFYIYSYVSSVFMLYYLIANL